MKYTLIPFLALALLIPVTMHAQETDTSVDANAEVTVDAEVDTPTLLPGNPLYFLKSFKERTQMFFTLSKEKKVERAAAFAEERQKEYEALVEEGKVDLAAKVKERHDAQVQKLEERIEAIRAENPEAAEKLETRLEERREMMDKRLEHRAEVLKERLENALDAARLGIERALQAPLNEGEARMRIRPLEAGASTTRSTIAPERSRDPEARRPVPPIEARVRVAQ